MSDLQRLLGDEPTLEFGAFLAKSGAGNKCTACLLDLELYYVEAQNKTLDAAPAATRTKSQQRMRLRHRLYELLDRWSPQVPIRFSNVVPILAGEDIDTSIVVSNDNLLFDSASDVDDIVCDIIVRNARGACRFQTRKVINVGESLRLDVSEHIRDEEGTPQDAPWIPGTVEIIRSWKRPSSRGTSRPQVIISAKGGCGAVHTQDTVGKGVTWFDNLFYPKTDRAFLAICNRSKSTQTFHVQSPLGLGESVAAETQQIEIAGLGTKICEITPSDIPEDSFAGQIYGARCTSPCENKILILNTSLNLDRFSIDHPAG